jgi:hypothetical protein
MNGDTDWFGANMFRMFYVRKFRMGSVLCQQSENIDRGEESKDGLGICRD